MSKEGKTRAGGKKKIFVLDTSVILYDHNAFQNFQENDVAIPIQVLEELDNMKNGNDTRNFEARSFIRMMDDLSQNNLISHWLPLHGINKGQFKIVVDKKTDTDAEEIFGDGKVDHRILNAALGLQHENPDKRVILVSKDICLRLKAKSLDLHAEDYETGKIKNLEQLYTGKAIVNKVPDKVLTTFAKNGILNPDDLELGSLQNNHFYILHGKKRSIPAFYNGQSKQLEEVVEQPVFNISPKKCGAIICYSCLT